MTLDLGEWLRSLGLERHEAAFRENEIDERVLPSLTQEDLKESALVLWVIAGYSSTPLPRCVPIQTRAQRLFPVLRR
jgi:hypothetical protein